jgi:hypothetical protein
MTSRTRRIHQVIILVTFISAILTVVPVSSASKACHLGYKALCSFTPYGTLILVVTGLLHIWMIRKETKDA